MAYVSGTNLTPPSIGFTMPSRKALVYVASVISRYSRICGEQLGSSAGLDHCHYHRIVTALIAGCIVKSEAVLFDLKDGYCSRDWRLAKRFCCPYGGAPDWDHPSLAASSWSYRTPFLPDAASARLLPLLPSSLCFLALAPVIASSVVGPLLLQEVRLGAT